MPTVKITRKYQVTIPKEIREKLNLRVGDLLRVEVEGDKIILKPVIKPRENPVEEMLNLIRESLDVDAVKLVEESWEDD